MLSSKRYLTSFLKKAIETDFYDNPEEPLASFGVLSGCNIFKAVLEVTGALFHREKVKLAAPEKGCALTYIAVRSGHPHKNRTNQ